MTTQPSNPNAAPSYDEADLLALVEGTPLPAERAARLREALANDPVLAELVTMLRADRDAVCSLLTAATPAPVDLLDRVEARLERDALVGLARSEANSVDDELPVSVVMPARRVWITRRVGAALAAAAAVAIIAGGVLMMIPGKHPVIAPPLPLPPVGPIASNEHAKPLTNNNVGGATPDTTSSSAGNTEIAAKTDAGNRELEGPPAPEAIAKAAPAASGPTMEQLLTAAQEGRLMLRVRDDEKVAAARLGGLDGNSRSLRVQALSVERSSQFNSALAGAFAKHRSVEPGAVKPAEPPAIADDHGPNANPHPVVPPVAKDSQPPITEDPPVLAAQAFVATVPAAAESLESLRRAMGALHVDWQIMPEAVRIDPPTDTSSILWWTAPATEWGPRFTIPVVIQTN